MSKIRVIKKKKTGKQRKKFREYVFQFLMVFLAIAGGFFMDNLRENYADRQKEKTYMTSMIEDIKEDTATIKYVISTTQNQCKGIDSLLQVMRQPAAQTDMHRFYMLISSYLNNLTAIFLREVTLTQLKNSGGFRLIRDKSVSDSIILYYTLYELHQGQLGFISNIFRQILNIQLSAMNYSALKESPSRYLFDRSRLNEFYNGTIWFVSLLKDEIIWLEDYQKRSQNLLKYLQAQYNVN